MRIVGLVAIKKNHLPHPPPAIPAPMVFVHPVGSRCHTGTSSFPPREGMDLYHPLPNTGKNPAPPPSVRRPHPAPVPCTVAWPACCGCVRSTSVVPSHWKFCTLVVSSRDRHPMAASFSPTVCWADPLLSAHYLNRSGRSFFFYVCASCPRYPTLKPRTRLLDKHVHWKQFYFVSNF